MYDALKRDVLAKGLAQGQSTYNIPVPPDDVDIEAKIYAARKDVMNQYIELSDIGIADENRLLSSPALFEQFKREGRRKRHSTISRAQRVVSNRSRCRRYSPRTK